MQGPGSTPEWKANLHNILKRTEDNLESRRIFLNQSSSPSLQPRSTLAAQQSFPTIPSAYNVPYSNSSLIASRVDQWKSRDEGEVEILKDQISELKKQNEELTAQITQLSAKINTRSEFSEDEYFSSKQFKWRREEFDKRELLESVKKDVEIVIHENQLEHQKEVMSLLTQQMQQVLQPLHQQMQQHLSHMDKMESQHDKLREQIQSTNQPLLQALQQQASLSQTVKFCESEVKEHKKTLENSTIQIQNLEKQLHTQFSSTENQQLQLRHQLERTQESADKQASLQQVIEDLRRSLEEVKSNHFQAEFYRKEFGILKEDHDKSKTTFYNLVEETKKSLSSSLQHDKEWLHQQSHLHIEVLKNDINSLRIQQTQMIPLLQNSGSRPSTPQQQQPSELPFHEINELKTSVNNLQLQTNQLDWRVKEASNSSKMEVDNLREQLSQYIQHLQKVNMDMLQQREEMQKNHQQDFSSIRQELLENKLQHGILKKEVESNLHSTSSLIEDSKRTHSEVVALRMEQGMLQQEVRLRLDSFQHLVNSHETSLQRLATAVASLQAVPPQIQTPRSVPNSDIPNKDTPRIVDKTDLDERVANLFNLQQDLFDAEKAIRDKLSTMQTAPVSQPTTAKRSVPKIVIEAPKPQTPPMSPQSKTAQDTAKVKRKIDFVQALDLSKLEKKLQEQQQREKEEEENVQVSSGTSSPKEESFEEHDDKEEVTEEEEEVTEQEQQEDESSLDDSLHFSDDENNLPIDDQELSATSPRISLNDLLAMNDE